MLGSSWPTIQEYILGASENWFIKFVVPWPPSLNFLLNRGRLRSVEFYNLQTGVLGQKLSSKDVFLK